MKTAYLPLIACLLAASVTDIRAQSMVPSAMNYQGLLTDNNGDPLEPTAPGNHTVDFRIYTSNTATTAVWGERQVVSVFKGNFSVILGKGETIAGTQTSGEAAFAALFDNLATSDLYFGITADEGTEFSPRQKLLASAFALRSRVAERVIQTAGESSFNTLRIGGSATIAGNNTLQFGAGLSGQESSAGKIGYRLFGNQDALDIVGAGTTTGNRKINLWADGGLAVIGGSIDMGGHKTFISSNGGVHGFGSQAHTTYIRTSSSTNNDQGTIAFYRGGSHSDTEKAPGSGGTTLALLNGSGFNLQSGVFTGNGSGLTNLNLANLSGLSLTGTNPLEFGAGLIKGPEDGKIAVGNWGGLGYGLNIGGVGTQANYSDRKVLIHAQGLCHIYGPTKLDGITQAMGTIYAKSGIVMEGSSTLSFTTPNRTGQLINLWGSDFGIGIQNSHVYFRTLGGFNWYNGGTHTDDPNTGNNRIANWSNDRCDFYRRVYIGAGINQAAPALEVNGAGGSIANYAYYARNSEVGGIRTGEGTPFTGVVSIKASERIVGQEFNATSDIRLKLPEGRSDAVADLQTLDALEITNYTMKDKASVGPAKFKKLIAQQVEQVFPQAVSKIHGNVPDVFQMAKANEGVITLKDVKSYKLAKGDTIRLLSKDQEITTKITAVSEDDFSVEEMVDGEIFVYGRQVDDVRTVDYEAISMLNVSATQELHRKVEQQAKDLASRQAALDAQRKQIETANAETATLAKRLAALEAKLDKIATASAGATSPKAVTVSITK